MHARDEGRVSEMINFAVGPVQADEAVLEAGAQQVPYFRTPEFSAVMLENERLFLQLLGAPAGSRAVFLTGSGTAAMEAAVMNVLGAGDKALVVDGGSFGHRFYDLCGIHGVPCSRVPLGVGRSLREEDLRPFEGAGFTALLVNLHETSTGLLYDIELIADFCERNGLLLIVDAISAFLADPLDMAAAGADVVIAGSQKALACPPGVSALAISPRALERVSAASVRCMYFDLKNALSNGERGQTPFTPAVGILLQLNVRLSGIARAGGVESEVSRVASLASYFREAVAGLPLEQLPENPSNALTALHTRRGRAGDVFAILKSEYGIWVCPNGGGLKDHVFRVGHIGSLTQEDFDALLDALGELQLRGVI